MIPSQQVPPRPHRRPASLFPNNQIRYWGDLCHRFAANRQANAHCQRGASAHIPDVPRQCSENIDVALTVRDSVRVLGSAEHAS
jgi:hypothetical protein